MKTDRNWSGPLATYSRRKCLSAYVSAISILMLTACGGSGSASSPAPAPGPVPSPAPTPSPPTPPPGPSPSPPPVYSATVSWSVPTLNTDGTSLTDISGYRIYFGTSANSLTQSVPVPGAATNSFVVDGLAAGTYYFAVTTLNSAGGSSVLSNPAAKTVP